MTPLSMIIDSPRTVGAMPDPTILLAVEERRDFGATQYYEGRGDTAKIDWNL